MIPVIGMFGESLNFATKSEIWAIKGSFDKLRILNFATKSKIWAKFVGA
jgi:hypothetical protein